MNEFSLIVSLASILISTIGLGISIYILLKGLARGVSQAILDEESSYIFFLDPELTEEQVNDISASLSINFPKYRIILTTAPEPKIMKFIPTKKGK